MIIYIKHNQPAHCNISLSETYETNFQLFYLFSELYLRRFKKEKRLRRKIQSQLEIESFKKAKLEEALSTLSYKTFLQVKDLRDNETNDKENFA